MKEHNDDTLLKHLLQDKLGEHTVDAPDFVWPAIEKELFPPAKKRRPFFWWFVFTGLILGVLSFYFLYPRNEFNFNINTREFVALEKTTASNSKSIQTYKSEIESTKIIDETSNKPITNKLNNIHSSSEKGTGNTSNFQNSSKSFKTQNPRTKKSKLNIQPSLQLSTTGSENKNVLLNETKTDDRTLSLEENTGESKIDDDHLTKSTDDYSNFEMSLLLAKKLDHTAANIPLQKTNLRYPRRFVPYSFLDLYAGLGRNSRNYSGAIETSKKALLVDRTLQFKNNNIGLDYNMQFCRIASFRVGLNMGTNRYTTRLFPVRIANVSLNDALDISSPSGDLKSAPLELDDQASPFLDTTTFLMRIIHRSSYFTVPLSIRFNTPNIRGPQVFAYSGIDLNFRGTDKNTLVVRKSQVERVFTTSKPTNAQLFYPGWHLGLGIATNPFRRLQVYSEFHYSTLFSDYYKGKIITIQSSNYQINLGLRFKLVANHDTKRLVK